MDLIQLTSSEKGRPGRRVIFELLLCIALSVGCWYTFFSMFPSPLGTVVNGLLVVCLPAGLYLLCRRPLLSRFLVVCVFLLTAAFFALAYARVWNGLLVMGNIILEVLNRQFSAGFIPFEMSGSAESWAMDTLFAMIPVMLLASIGIAHSVYHKEPLLGFVLSAIPVLTGLCLKVEPSMWLLILLLLGWTGLLLLSAVAKPVSRKKNRPIYLQSATTSKLPCIFLGITFVLLLGYVLLFSGDDYRPPQSVDEAKTKVIAAEEHLRYDPLSGDEIDSLSRGDLTDTHPLAYTDATVLSLRMEVPQAMHLRGFAGGSYENGKWTEAADGAYSGEYTGIMEWLAQQNYYPWMQQDRLYRMTEGYDFAEVNVENINGSSKYIYLPYEAALAGDVLPDNVNYEKDYVAFAKGLRGQREYAFRTFLTDREDFSETELTKWLEELKKSPDWEDYADNEAVYRRYVYDTYLDISPEDWETISASGIEECLGKTLDYTLHFIRKLFAEDFTYDTEQEVAPAGKDELSWFFERHSGNDMHFATAATLMFRSAGIPARYVEGYYLSPQDVFLYEDTTSDVRVDILDSQAHGWVEIYMDGLGWFPAEVIPGFFDLEKQVSEKEEEQEDIKEKNQRSYQDEAPENKQDEAPQEDEAKSISVWYLLISVIILLLIILELLGRLRIKKLLASFTTPGDAQVYKMYRYVGKAMAFDGNPLPIDPYEKLAELSDRYDGAAEMTTAQFFRLVSRVRFGGGSLTASEQNDMARYAVGIGRHVYTSQNMWKRFVMKFIRFLV